MGNKSKRPKQNVDDLGKIWLEFDGQDQADKGEE